MEAQINKISKSYVTKDKLEAEITKAKLDGVKAGACIASLLFAGICAVAAVIALI